MTTLRFVGDLPFWIGLTLALIVAVLSWRYYRRESFDLPFRLRWLLPLLRSSAFFLGVLVLTGPVLHHRTIIGELGRVKIYVDMSGSMTMHDRHMTTGRKLLIAEQLGWLVPGKIDVSLLNTAETLAGARRELLDAISRGAAPAVDTDAAAADNATPPPGETSAAADSSNGSTEPIDVAAAHAAFLRACDSVKTQLAEDVIERFQLELLQPLTELNVDPTDPKPAVDKLGEIAIVCQSFETAMQQAFDDSIQQIVNSGDQSIQTALTMFDETPRWRRAELGLADSTAHVLNSLRQQHNVDLFYLSANEAQLQNAPQNQSAESAKGLLPSAEGVEEPKPPRSFADVTDLSSGVASTQQGAAVAADNEGATDVAHSAIVLITDGQHNSGPSPLQTARVLGSQGVPVYCLSIGASEEAQDLAVLGLEYPDLVFQKDRVRGTMIIRDRMNAGRPFVAEIRHEDEVLWREQLLTMDIPERRIEFDFAIDDLVEKLGEQFSSAVKLHTLPLNLKAAITPVPEESETGNNELEMRLAAITEGYKLLILDGRPRWETRYLRNVFERDEQWSVNTVIAGPSTDNIELPRGDQAGQFPPDRESLFDYDMIIYGEVSSELLSAHEFDWLREFVELRGGGIVFIDGQRGKLLSLTEQSLVTLLPVEWVPDDVTSKPTALQLTEKGAGEPSLKLVSDEQANRRFWTELPPPHNLVAVNALPGAEVLVEATENGQQRPLMVTRNYGAGKVVYLASDETWRWRYKAADTWHQRIWNQIAKFVMPRPFAVSDEYLSVDTGSVSYNFGDSVDIRVRLMGLDGRPAINATADALVWKNGRVVSTVSLRPDADVPGIYRGRTTGLVQGDYEVSVQASGYSESVLKARSQFVVLPPASGELATTAANEQLLKQMAAASSGMFLHEEEMGRLPDLLSPLSNGRVVESDTLIWQSYWWFAAIVILLTVEWILRKRAGLL